MSHPLISPLVHPLDVERFGAKAALLARAAALGARVPPSLVVPVDAHGAALARTAHGGQPGLPATLREVLERSLPGLGPAPWAVRTSAPTEDLPGASAAGLYHSELGLTNPAQVVAAAERCWEAARADGVRLYLRATGHTGPLPTVALLLQRQVQARWAGVLFTRDPREGPHAEHLRCELARASTSGVTAGLLHPVAHTLDRRGGCWPGLPPDAGISGPELVALATLAEEAAGGPADVELALTRDGPVVLQVRPITAWSAPSTPPRERQEDGLTWCWDAEHNPAPLSPLHASLVARLDGNPALPFRLRCVDGYLYHAPRPGVVPPPPETPDQIHRAWTARQKTLEGLVAALERQEQEDAPGGSHGDDTAGGLDRALEAFDSFYEGYATLAGAPLGSAQSHLAALLDRRLAQGELRARQLPEALAGVSTPLTSALGRLASRAAEHPELLPRLARGEDVSGLPRGAALETDLGEVIARLGALPPAWDLATPTLGESPGALRRAVATLARTGIQSPDLQPSPGEDPHLRNLAADEEDDLLFARALAVLRRACLRAGEQLVRAGRLERSDEVFELDLTTLRAELTHPGEGPLPRSGHGRQRRAQPPPAPPGGVLRGFGTGGGEIRGRALLVDPLERELTEHAGAAAGRIVVCASLLPSAVVLLAGAAGIITDHGGLLSHGAILARELGVPAVLGTREATARIRTGDGLWLDGWRGLVVLLKERG